MSVIWLIKKICLEIIACHLKSRSLNSRLLSSTGGLERLASAQRAKRQMPDRNEKAAFIVGALCRDSGGLFFLLLDEDNIRRPAMADHQMMRDAPIVNDF